MKLTRYAVRALRKVGLLDNFVFNVPIKLSGKVVQVPMVKGVGFIYVLDFEPFMDELIKRLTPLFPGVFVDAGVNLGQTLIKAKAARPDIVYLGLEPNPVCVDYTQRLVRANNFANVTLVPAGLTDHDGEGGLVLWNGEAGDPTASLHSDLKPQRANQREVPVKLVPWATVEKQAPIGKLGFVKIDVEGSELDVLEQLAPRLRSDRPITVVEVLPPYDPPMPERVERQKRMEALFRSLDMKLFRIHKDSSPLRLEPLEEFGIFTLQELSDHLVVPSERVNDVLKAFAR